MSERFPPPPASLPLGGALIDGRHHLAVRVYYEDTDFSGIVYHASYLRFMERGRTDFLRLLGASQSDLHAEGEGLAFAVRRMTIDFLRAARMDDILEVITEPAEVRGASMTLAQRVMLGDQAIVTAQVMVAAIRNGRAVRIPDGLRAVMAPRA